MAGTERATLRSAYLYLVCLVTLVLALFAAVNLVRGVVELAYPDPGYFAYGPVPEEESTVTAEERAAREEAARDSQRRHAVVSLVGNGTMLLVAAPVYLYHWRRVQAEQRQDVARA